MLTGAARSGPRVPPVEHPRTLRLRPWSAPRRAGPVEAHNAVGIRLGRFRPGRSIRSLPARSSLSIRAQNGVKPRTGSEETKRSGPKRLVARVIWEPSTYLLFWHADRAQSHRLVNGLPALSGFAVSDL